MKRFFGQKSWSQTSFFWRVYNYIFWILTIFIFKIFNSKFLKLHTIQYIGVVILTVVIPKVHLPIHISTTQNLKYKELFNSLEKDSHLLWKHTIQSNLQDVKEWFLGVDAAAFAALHHFRFSRFVPRLWIRVQNNRYI